MRPHQPPAVVVGLCAHGLAIVRALAKSGIEVHALEPNTERPGFRTRYAKVHRVQDVNGTGLVDSLLNLKLDSRSSLKPVLFLTNDNMVRTVARAMEIVASRFAVSWASCSSEVYRLVHKDSLEAVCQDRGLLYPASRILNCVDEIKVAESLRFPLIIKPVKPLSRFKTRKVADLDGLAAQVEAFSSELPMVLQEWIEGNDEGLYFCAFYFDRGEVVARFVGHKIESIPPSLGQTLIAEPSVDDVPWELGKRFFQGSELTGPASIEFKKDPDGRYWVIEPTLGRTDYWVDCCISNGVNLPVLEYQHQTGGQVAMAASTNSSIWYDTERDASSYLRHVVYAQSLRPRAKTPVFPYFLHGDWHPFLTALACTLREFPFRVWRRLRRIGQKSRK